MNYLLLLPALVLKYIMGVLLGAIKLVRNITLCFQDVEKIVPVTMTYQAIKSYSRLENNIKIYIRSTLLILYHTKFVLSTLPPIFQRNFFQ